MIASPGPRRADERPDTGGTTWGLRFSSTAASHHRPHCAPAHAAAILPLRATSPPAAPRTSGRTLKRRSRNAPGASSGRSRGARPAHFVSLRFLSPAIAKTSPIPQSTRLSRQKTHPSRCSRGARQVLARCLRGAKRHKNGTKRKPQSPRTARSAAEQSQAEKLAPTKQSHRFALPFVPSCLRAFVVAVLPPRRNEPTWNLPPTPL
jgi:hypothetical protein